MFVGLMMVVAAPAFSAEATQIWKCEMDDDTTEKQVRDMAREWLKAAKSMAGGENMKATVLFPVAVNMTGDTDVMFVIVTPTFEEWGKFWDGYEGSPAAKVDQQNQQIGVVCPDSAVWESITVE
jgi:hypothetical protein